MELNLLFLNHLTINLNINPVRLTPEKGGVKVRTVQ